MTHASVETFDITMQFPHRAVLFRGGIVSGIESGMVQHRQRLSSVFPNGQAAVRQWTVTIENCTATDYARMVELYDLTAGGCEPVDITVRGMALDGSASETVQVRLRDEPLLLASVSPRHYAFQLQLEEFGHAP